MWVCYWNGELMSRPCKASAPLNNAGQLITTVTYLIVSTGSMRADSAGWEEPLG